MPMAVAPGMNLYAGGDEAGDLALFDGTHAAALVRLDIAQSRSFTPQFDLGGNLLAWGNKDGTVTVCNLRKIKSRLDEIKLGW